MSGNARGDQAKWKSRRQADFNTVEAAADGKFYQLPFYSLNINPSEDTSEDDAIHGDAFPGEVVAGLRNLTGDVEVPMGLSSIGWHLAALLGDPVTTGPDVGGVYTHVFKASGAPALNFYTTGVSHTGIDVHFKQASVAYSSIDLSAKKDGKRARASFGLVGVRETKELATIDATPVEYALDPVPVNFQSGVLIGGVEVAGVTGQSIKLDLKLEADQEEMNESVYAAAITSGKWELTGSIDARFRDTTWYDRGDAGTLIDLETRWVHDADHSLTLVQHNLRFDRKGVPVTGGDVITSSFDYRAGRPDAGGTPFTVTLKNKVADYSNPV